MKKARLLTVKAVLYRPVSAHRDGKLIGAQVTGFEATLDAFFESGRGCQYTAFCTRYKDRTGQLKRSMRQIHRAGEGRR